MPRHAQPLPMSPEAHDRAARLKALCDRLGLTKAAFGDLHGFSGVQLWRWVRNGDPTFSVRAAGRKEMSARTLAAAGGVSVAYLTPGGPPLPPAGEEAAPYREVPPTVRLPYKVQWTSPADVGASLFGDARLAQRAARKKAKGLPPGSTVSVIIAETGRTLLALQVSDAR